MICSFGCGKIAVKQFKSGNWCCSVSTSSCPAMKLKNSNEHTKETKSINWIDVQEKYNNGWSLSDLELEFSLSQGVIRGAINRGNLLVRSQNEGLTLARKNGKCKLTESARKSLEHSARIRILKRYEDGWLPKAGRCKKYRYVSPIAGSVLLDGTWELKVAEWLDKNQYNWKRNTKRFPYINLKGKLSYYTPDFLVEELGGYLEIKGYETKLDRCKWKQFEENLTVWKEKELKDRKILL